MTNPTTTTSDAVKDAATVCLVFLIYLCALFFVTTLEHLVRNRVILFRVMDMDRRLTELRDEVRALARSAREE